MSGSSAFTLGKARKTLRAALPPITFPFRGETYVQDGDEYRPATALELRLIDAIREVVPPAVRVRMAAKMAASPGDPPVPGSHSRSDVGRGGRI